jgi:hypothetical protein
LWRSLRESLLKTCGKVSTSWRDSGFCTWRGGKSRVFHGLVKSFPMGFPRRLTGVYGQFCTVSTGLTITTIIILGSFGAIPRRFAEKEKVRTFKSSVQKVRR